MRIGILTGGGDVPGLNPCIKALVYRAVDEGHEPIILTPGEKKGRDYYQQVELLNEKIKNALVGKHLDKGEMFSYFQFGGSDCVVVFERKANVNVTAKVGTHYPIRSQYAIANINE